MKVIEFNVSFAIVCNTNNFDNLGYKFIEFVTALGGCAVASNIIEFDTISHI